MATEKIFLNFIPNSYWEISEPVFFSKNCTCNFVCMGNKWVGDCETISKDLYPSRHDHIKFLATFLNDPHNQSVLDFDIERIKNPKFELFLRSIDGFLISVEYIPGGYGFHFYPAPITFNIAKNNSVGRIKFIGSSFRVAEKKLLVSYRNPETLERKSVSIDLSLTELNALKKVICYSVLTYMKEKQHFGWSFYLSDFIKKKLSYFE